jgi:signal transduction histidine kinase
MVDAEYAAIGISEGLEVLRRLITSSQVRQDSKYEGELEALLEAMARLFKGGTPVRLTHFSEETRSELGPGSLTSNVKSFLGVPIVAGDRTLGNLYLTNKVGPGSFTEQDQELMEFLAAHAAAAMRRAALLQAREQYEKQLKNRNRQLAALNRATMAIAEELTLDKVLHQIVESVRDLAGAQYAALGVPNNEGGLDSFVHSGMSPDEAAKMSHFPRGRGLLGAIIREKRSIRIASVLDDPRSAGFPPGHPPMTSFMGVPVMAGGHVLGNLYLTNKIGGDEFSADDQEMVEMLAAHAAIVIQNSRLYEQVGRLAIIAERARIGMDLHDGIIQSIYAVGLTLESARLTLTSDEVEVDQLLERAIGGLNDAIRDIRNFILDLRPHRFSGDLIEGISRLVREFQVNAMIPVTLRMSPEVGMALPPPVSRAIFLTTQEALANIARHARAKNVVIAAERSDSIVALTVTDDGGGFDTKLQLQTVGHGLSNMRARAETLKGTFALHSAPGEGTRIELMLPCV